MKTDMDSFPFVDNIVIILIDYYLWFLQISLFQKPNSIHR